ncbi:type IV secretory system conjugative DNA transfer family protein [Planomicrobium okeanokoites]|uniref:type IV secretory system conjugative DNA transfer family protein n=1 Tax=Planomicrobium okeanokoites TaxID=244 RepID=UPI000A001CE0|nr:TraM recognition domain-containing protein [Planomicrobium okeanokoites]
MKNIDWQKWKSRLPLLTAIVSMAISGYFALFYLIRVIRLLHSQYIGEEVNYLWWLVGSNDHVTLLGVISVSVIGYFGFLISTRVKVLKKKWLRLTSFIAMHVARWSGLVAYGMGGIKAYVIPFFQERLANVITTDDFVESVLFEHADGFYLMLTSLPLLFVGFVLLFLMSEYSLNDKELNKAFFAFEYKGKWMQKFGKLEKLDIWPDVELGENTVTEEMVTIPGFDRSLNSLIVGGIGTGKTAALALPMLNQDLHHMTRFINEFPKLSKREDYLSKDVAGRHLNGITVIEPSNDLCQKTLQLVKAHGIPDEAITYINPLDPETPSINPMRGPVDKVAEVFAQIIAGLNNSGASGNFFFEQAQRNHLKQHIYLLKLHDPDLQPTFETLIDMYNNPNLVHEMHVKLKTTIPKKIDEIEDRQERNYWKIIQGIDEWFDLTILPMKERAGNGEQQVFDKVTGKAQFFDAKSEHVQGLRNILNDIGSNPYIRNVLFGESEFDFDEHFAKGGVLLVNTAKGQLVDLARVLGKLVLMNLQNATFRRPNDISPFHHIMVDEAPDYFYDAFREFPVQSRKYKVIITTIMQTIAQLADEYGENYMTTIIAGMRNRMVYGDVPAMDAEYFSNLFGEKEVFDEGQTEMSVSPLQDNPQTRGGSSYAKVKEPAMTPAEIMFQKAFHCAVKIVEHNEPKPVQQIKANFLPAEAFVEADIQVMEKSLKKWLSYRNGEIIVIEDKEEVKVFEDLEQEAIIMQEDVAAEKLADVATTQESDESEEAARIPHDTRPTDKLPESVIQKFVLEKDSIAVPIEIPKEPLVAAPSAIEKEPVLAAVEIAEPAPVITSAHTVKEPEKAPVEKPKAKPIASWTPQNETAMFGDLYATEDMPSGNEEISDDETTTENKPSGDSLPLANDSAHNYEESKITSQHLNVIEHLTESMKVSSTENLQENEKKSND